MIPLSTPVMFHKAGRLAVGQDQVLIAIESVLEPLLLVLSMWASAWFTLERITPPEMILAIFVFALTFPGAARLSHSTLRGIRNILLGWLTLAGLLAMFGYATGYLEYFKPEMLLTWLWMAPAFTISGHLTLRLLTPLIRLAQGGAKLAVVAGMNEQGVELARRLGTDAYTNVQATGFFEDRGKDRLNHTDEFSILGKINDLPQYVKQHRIDIIYLALPMASQNRIVALLDALRDTTASIYFVPDIFVTELIQGRMDSVGGIPIVGVCDSPFSGADAFLKRSSDFMLSLAILFAISPLLLLIALATKLSSRGPVFFKQRRYGLDGSEIKVYKFRTMTVMEDGHAIRQAKTVDDRVTPLGAFLRRTSLDELPQFINVLQGRMSVVGPRPHAVAHNEMYRKLIKGYMQRHKVKPGITGWAQVNGLRGETETLDKMKSRVDHDLYYLRNWSVRLDLFIIAKTVWVVLKGMNAH